MVGDETTVLETLLDLILKSRKERDADAEVDRASKGPQTKSTCGLMGRVRKFEERVQNKE